MTSAHSIRSGVRRRAACSLRPAERVSVSGSRAKTDSAVGLLARLWLQTKRKCRRALASGAARYFFANAATVSARSASKAAGFSRIRKCPLPGSTRSW